MAGDQIEFICEMLKGAVNSIMDPISSPQKREEAAQLCDDIKEKSDVCAPCGLKLAEKTGSAPVRYFGLQLIEHHVRTRWDNLSLQERKSLKNSVMGLVASGTNPILEEENRIKEVLVHVLVEMIKRDWATDWSDLFTEMHSVCRQGATQAELVMLSLSMLAQDMKLWSTSSQTPVPLRKEKGIELNNKKQAVLGIVRSVINDFVQSYQVLKQCSGELAGECQHLIITALDTLAAYVGLVPLEDITENKCQLLDSLWCLQSEPDLQLEAAEVLLLAVKRISKIPGKNRPIVELADEVAPIIYPFPLISDEDALTERGYSFLKSRCQLLCVFGEQFFPPDVMPGHAKIPSTFAEYLNSLLAFTTHCSQFLSSLTQKTWRMFFSHKALRSNSELAAMLPKYLLATSINLMTVGFPSKNNSRKCEYSRLDFATDQAFSKFLRTFRGKQMRVIDAACSLYKKQCLETAISCLKRQMTSSVDLPLENVRKPGDVNSDSDHSYLQWEALVYFIEIIVGNINPLIGALQQNDAMELLQTVLIFKTEEPIILAFVPKLLDVFRPFLNFKNGSVSSVLTKLLEIIQQIRSPDGPLLMIARRDACILINKLCREKAQEVLLDFNMFFNHVKQLLCNERLQLTQMEKNALVEAMVVLINQLMDYEQQKAFLEELLAPVSSLWVSEEIGRVFAEPETLVSYVGADLNITDTLVESPMDLNRSGILHCLATILEVLRWSCCPADLKKAEAGGFVIGVKPDGEPLFRNPCAEQVLKLLDNVFVLIRTQHKLFLPTVQSKMSNRFPRVLARLEVKNTCTLDPQPLLAIYDPPEYETALERLQFFFTTMYASCFCILGYAASSLTQGFYTIPNLCNKLLYFAFENLENVPDYRLLVMFRSFLKPLVHSSPPEYYETLVPPIMGAFLPPLHTRLAHEWNILDENCKSNQDKTAVGSTGSVKILPKQLKRLTKEVIELIIECCVSPEDEDIIANTEESNAANDQGELDKGRYSCSQATDKPVGAAKSEIVCPLSTEVDSTIVCVPESDDYMSTDEDSAMAVAVKTDELGRQINEHAESSSESDDGEEAAEAAEAPQSAPLVLPENTHLTKLGICLMEHEDVRSALLATAYSSLVWKDLTCYKAASNLCWPLLKHVILEPLHSDTVTYVMTMAVKGLQVHKQDKFSNCAFDNLAFQIYMCLRPRYIELNKVVSEILNINLCYLEKFDECALYQPIKKSDELFRYFKCLLYGRIEEPFFEQQYMNQSQITKKSRKRPPYYMRSNKLQRPVYNPMNRPLPYKKKEKL